MTDILQMCILRNDHGTYVTTLKCSILVTNLKDNIFPITNIRFFHIHIDLKTTATGKVIFLLSTVKSRV